MNILKKLFIKFYEDNLDRKKIVLQLRRYHEKKYINMELLSMLLGVFKVQETRVKDIMIPRSRMVIIRKNSSIDEILPLIINSSHSRFPVILENKDEIVGILLAKDLLKYIKKDNDNFNIEEIIRPSVIIPETKKLNILLSEFKSGRNHLAVVVDEYGGVSGLITIEDVLEQIVGDIEDEHDTDEEKDNILEIPFQTNRFRVRAGTSLEQFNKHFSTKFYSDSVETIGGYVTDHFGHVPRRGEITEIGRVEFEIQRADARRIYQLVVNIEKVHSHKPGDKQRMDNAVNGKS